MGKYLRLFRYPNLLLIIITQLIIEYFIVLPSLKMAGQTPVLNTTLFLLLVVATLIITAIGYVQNDIEDIEMDRINKPEKMLIGRLISIASAKTTVLLLTILGTILAVYVALQIEQLVLALIFPIAVLLLILYAKKLKKGFLLGNLLVSLFVSGVAAIVWFAERKGLAVFLKSNPEDGKFISMIFLAYLTFAFLANLYREIVKDMQDLEGDKALGGSTLPIIWGLNSAKWMALSIASILCVLVITLAYYLLNNDVLIGVYWILLFILIPLLFSIFTLLLQPLQKSTFKKVSSAIKLIMLTGLLLLIIVFK